MGQMKYFLFFGAVLTQILLAVYIAAWYMRRANKLKARADLSSFILQFAMIIPLVCVYIPFCIFFPLLIGELLGVIAPNRDERSIAIFFGIFGLSGSFIYGVMRAKK